MMTYLFASIVLYCIPMYPQKNETMKNAQVMIPYAMLNAPKKKTTSYMSHAIRL